MASQFLHNGIRLRWLNTAGFEIEMSNGKHILLDPFLDAQINGIPCWPLPLDAIERCDYLCLSHIHFDHAQDVGCIQQKFPGTYIFCPALSVDPLCRAEDLDCARIFPVHGGDSFTFDDVKIQVFPGRHTESPRGYRPSGKDFVKPDGTRDEMMWFGNMELVNYLITTNDGTRILVWAGMTSPDQKHCFADLHPDLALMHVSPKQDFAEFAALTAAMGTKVIIPHHYDCTEKLFEAVPEAMNNMSEANRKAFVHDGKFSFPEYMRALETACRAQNPGAALVMPEHHRWYRFGFCCAAE